MTKTIIITITVIARYLQCIRLYPRERRIPPASSNNHNSNRSCFRSLPRSCRNNNHHRHHRSNQKNQLLKYHNKCSSSNRCHVVVGSTHWRSSEVLISKMKGDKGIKRIMERVQRCFRRVIRDICIDRLIIEGINNHSHRLRCRMRSCISQGIIRPIILQRKYH